VQQEPKEKKNDNFLWLFCKSNESLWIRFRIRQWQKVCVCTYIYIYIYIYSCVMCLKGQGGWLLFIPPNLKIQLKVCIFVFLIMHRIK